MTAISHLQNQQQQQPPDHQPQQQQQQQRSCRKLIVEVIEARNLIPKDGTGSSSAYVVATFNRERKRTSSKYKDLNPVWNEAMEFVVTDVEKMEMDELEIEVYNDEKMCAGRGRKSHFLGRVKLRGSQFAKRGDEGLVYWSLEKKSVFGWVRGEIGLRIYYYDEEDGSGGGGEAGGEGEGGGPPETAERVNNFGFTGLMERDHHPPHPVVEVQHSLRPPMTNFAHTPHPVVEVQHSPRPPMNNFAHPPQPMVEVQHSPRPPTNNFAPPPHPHPQPEDHHQQH